VALVLSAVLLGYNWVVMKTALHYADPATFAAMRTFFAAVLLFVALVVLRRPLRPPHLLLTSLVGLFGITGATGLTIWALQHGQAGKTSVLVYTNAVWILIMAWIFLGERVRGGQWLFASMALVGLLFVIAPWHEQGALFSNLLGVAAGICSAAGSITAKMLTGDKRVDLLTLNAWQMLFGSIPLVVIALITTDTGPQWTGWFIATLFYNAALASPVALLLWFYALRNLPAGTAGLGRLLAPVIGVLTSWIQLGERPNIYEAVGMLLIIAALAALASGRFEGEHEGPAPPAKSGAR
jgi:drug/metabolite transporter (DMT)-like permease